MRKRICFAVLAVLLAPALTVAQSAFDGTWKINLKKAEFSKKPDVYLLQNGVWHCKSCVPPIEMKADGKDHAPPEPSACSETASVKVIDARTILVTDKGKDGKVTGTSKGTVSADGKTLTFESTDTCNAKGEAVTSKEVEQRVAAGPAGTHAISGSWRTVKADQSSDSSIETIKVAGGSITESYPTGETFTAKLGGPFVEIAGDREHSLVSAKLEGADTIVESVKWNGKINFIKRMTVAPGSNTMTVVGTNPRSGTVDHWTEEKQP
jgi:hypothetical protein